jgi:hypothetical protein
MCRCSARQNHWRVAPRDAAKRVAKLNFGTSRIAAGADHPRRIFDQAHSYAALPLDPLQGFFWIAGQRATGGLGKQQKRD